GLNIFNDKYILANPETATDQDYANIDAVVAHEYFHNWTGNRITCRDWFQLSLKEGLTVFRDQSFSADIGSAAVTRIDEVRGLRAAQFPEDNGPLAHPIRPDSYMEMNNFYTSTVYEKGAEVIRMMHTLLGPVKYRKAMDLYFQRHDGQAVTCDDFVQAMEDAGGIDLSQFKKWYSQAGTPELTISSDYDQQAKELQVTVQQHTKSTPDQDKKSPLHIPLSVGLFSDHKELESRILEIKGEKQSFRFNNVKEKPVLSLLRGFSAPVKLKYDYTDSDLAFLMAHDTDDFVRWEAGQLYALRQLQGLIKAHQENKLFSIDEGFMTSFRKILINQKLDKSLITLMLVLPSENYLADLMDEIDIDAIHYSRQWMRQEILKEFKEDLLQAYYRNQSTKPYRYVVEDVAKRSLGNICLQYLSLEAEKDNYSFILQQFEGANNMTDKMAALSALSHIDCPERLKALGTFYQQWQTEPLVLDKWFRVQATSSLPKTLSYVQKLTEHPAFSLKNPNKVYNLLGAFAGGNPVRFHDPSGLGYNFLADYVIKLNKTNPQVASRLVQPLTKWQRHDSNRKGLMRSQLERILKEPKISKGLYEIVSKGLK
ncbi:MAG TPA: aminopeptidase N, partial [Spirochaetes bacterium]|nr:aminopeptidase N [Spirochaetota bacterium]